MHHVTRRMHASGAPGENTWHARPERNAGRFWCLFICDNCTKGDHLAVNEGGGKRGQLPDLLSKHGEERSEKNIISTSVPVVRPKFRFFFCPPMEVLSCFLILFCYDWKPSCSGAFLFHLFFFFFNFSYGWPKMLPGFEIENEFVFL